MVKVRSLCFGSRVRTVLSSVLVLAVAAVVVVGLGVAIGVFGVPSVEGVDNRFGSVNETSTAIETNITIDNPNPIGINLGGLSVSYEVTMNDVRMATGEKNGISVDSGASTVSLRTRMNNERLPGWWVSHIENDEQTTMDVDGSAESSLLGQSTGFNAAERTISTDIDSAFDTGETRPINASRPAVSDPVLYLNETSGSWGDVNDATTEIDMRFVVYNPKSYAIPVSQLAYNMTMNDVAVGSGASENTRVLEPGTKSEIRTTTVMENGRLDEWWVSHLENGQVTDLEIAFGVRIDLTEAAIVDLGAIDVPLDTVEHRFETDVFGSENASEA